MRYVRAYYLYKEDTLLASTRPRREQDHTDGGGAAVAMIKIDEGRQVVQVVQLNTSCGSVELIFDWLIPCIKQSVKEREREPLRWLRQHLLGLCLMKTQNGSFF